ncbi:hypothetical protein K3495_g1566 [Podosphaera aphanis]|nr:hypothetical protein K3495_g1566 [Podosphaera aphanis]
MDSKPAKIHVPRTNYARYAHSIAQWVRPPSILDTIEEVEAYAQELCFQLSNAIKATGTRIGKCSGKSAPFWTPKCKAAHMEYQIATAPSQRDTCAKAETTPPLKHNEILIKNPAEPATILRDALLARHQASDDLPPCTTPSDNRIPWTESITEEEVWKWKHVPGADGVSVELLEICRKTIGPYVTDFFRACTNLGTYPTCFKLAEFVLLPKTDRDLTTVKGWRPIALLSCLGRGLERLLAKRMAHLAVTYDVVGSQQFGALLKRSETNLVSCVVHDIEEARAAGWAATFVTLDVQGAFDAVLHNRFIRRVREHGWPDHILRWASSFLANRQARVRYTGGVTMERELVCGVPQGSSISPLLFLLYMAESMRSGHAELRSSYADDVGILGFDPKVAESAAVAQREVDLLLA